MFEFGRREMACVMPRHSLSVIVGADENDRALEAFIHPA